MENKKRRKGIPLRWKSYLVVQGIAIILAAVGCLSCYRIYSNSMNEHYINVTTNIANTAAAILNGDQVERFRDKVISVYEKCDNHVDSTHMGTEEFENYISNFDNIEDEDYEQIHEILADILETNDVESVYVASMYEPDHIGFYIVDSSDTQPLKSGTYDTLDESSYTIFENPEEGFPAYISNTPEYGYLCCVGTPIYNSDGEVVAYSYVDISMNDVYKDRTTFLHLLILMLAVISIVLGLIAYLIVNNGLVSPVNKLADAAKSYVEKTGESGTGLFDSISIKTGDEIEDLGNAMVKMEKDINEYIDNLTKVTAEKERIGAELNVAKDIQANMLPNIFPAYPERKEMTVYATMTPAKEVGGDFYDYFFVDKDHFAIVMADVSGKGVPAALFMVIAKTMIKNRALMGGTPAEILEYVNNQLCESNEAQMFVTAWLTIIDLNTGKAASANAGHEYPAIRRKNGEYELIVSKHSIALAAIENVKYRNTEYELYEGDSIFVYTDGVTEATSSEQELFGNDRLVQALNIDPDAMPDKLIPIVKGEIDKFVDKAPQFDDITMLSFKYNGDN